MWVVTNSTKPKPQNNPITKTGCSRMPAARSWRITQTATLNDGKLTDHVSEISVPPHGSLYRRKRFSIGSPAPASLGDESWKGYELLDDSMWLLVVIVGLLGLAIGRSWMKWQYEKAASFRSKHFRGYMGSMPDSLKEWVETRESRLSIRPSAVVSSAGRAYYPWDIVRLYGDEVLMQSSRGYHGKGTAQVQALESYLGECVRFTEAVWQDDWTLIRGE